jgi:tetratricopeptide (TPR) repeat protein
MTDEQDYKHDLFISYNRTDEKWAERLAARLEQEDYQGRKLKVFFAPWDIRPGESVDERLDHALAESRYVGLVLSPESVKSEWVSEEWYSKHHSGMKRRERRIIPLYRHTCEIPLFLDHLNRIDVRDDDKFDEGVRLLLAVLRGEPLPRGAPEDAPKGVLPPSSIPRPPSFGFVSRRDPQGRDIVGRLREELAPGRDQLVTLSGPGGIGKSTLAAQAARELQETYGRRVVWSSADGRADFMFLSLLDDIATQLGRADMRTLAPSEKEEQVRALVADALVVLDNYETVTEAEQKRIENWFKRTKCSALFTSRPRIPDTVFVPVSAMSREEAAEFLEKLAGQTQDPRMFTTEVRERVYETAEANPYVMQWVVGQIDLALEPGAVLEELRHGEGDAALRVFDRSFELPLLGNDGRDALLALSLFAPSATPDALSTVAGFDDAGRVSEAVKNLRRLWLVKGVDGNRRLAVEGLTRTLAGARLTKDPRAAEFRRRFIAYFLLYAEAREEPTPENYDALEEEKDNLLGAVEVAFTSEDWESVMRMAYALANPTTRAAGMLIVRGYWDEAVRLGEQGLRAARSSQYEAEIAGLSHNLAVMYQDRGELAEARRLYDESLEIKKRLGDQGRVAVTLHQLGILAHGQGELEEARRLYDESLEIAKRLGNQGFVASTLHNLAILAQEQGELKEARHLYGESLEIKKRLGDQGSVASTLHQLGRLAQNQGELEEARRLFGESLEIAKKLGNQGGVAITLHQLGRLAEDKGDKAEAARLFRESLSIFERLGSLNAEIARRNLARVEGEGS